MWTLKCTSNIQTERKERCETTSYEMEVRGSFCSSGSCQEGSMSSEENELVVVVIMVVTNTVAPEPEGLSPRSSEPATGPYREPGESTQLPPTPSKPVSLRSILIPSSHLRLDLVLMVVEQSIHYRGGQPPRFSVFLHPDVSNAKQLYC
jgi:hypothetical protein